LEKVSEPGENRYKKRMLGQRRGGENLTKARSEDGLSNGGTNRRKRIAWWVIVMWKRYCTWPSGRKNEKTGQYQAGFQVAVLPVPDAWGASEGATKLGEEDTSEGREKGTQPEVEVMFASSGPQECEQKAGRFEGGVLGQRAGSPPSTPRWSW